MIGLCCIRRKKSGAEGNFEKTVINSLCEKALFYVDKAGFCKKLLGIIGW